MTTDIQDTARWLCLFSAAEQPAFKPWLSGLVEAFATEASCASTFLLPVSNNPSKMRNLNWGSTIYLHAHQLPSWTRTQNRSALLLPVGPHEKHLQLGRRPPAQEEPASLVWLCHLGEEFEKITVIFPKKAVAMACKSKVRGLWNTLLCMKLFSTWKSMEKWHFVISTDLLSSRKYQDTNLAVYCCQVLFVKLCVVPRELHRARQSSTMHKFLPFAPFLCQLILSLQVRRH